MVDNIIGERIYPDSEGNLWLKEGEYGKGTDGIWYAKAPGLKSGFGSLQNHQVTEHDDGTISVSPSIVMENHTGYFHGFLKNGIWNRC